MDRHIARWQQEQGQVDFWLHGVHPEFFLHRHAGVLPLVTPNARGVPHAAAAAAARGLPVQNKPLTTTTTTTNSGLPQSRLPYLTLCLMRLGERNCDVNCCKVLKTHDQTKDVESLAAAFPESESSSAIISAPKIAPKADPDDQMFAG